MQDRIPDCLWRSTWVILKEMKNPKFENVLKISYKEPFIIISLLPHYVHNLSVIFV